MYLWDIPFVLSGILFLLKKKEGHWWLVPMWLLNWDYSRRHCRTNAARFKNRDDSADFSNIKRLWISVF